MYGVHYPNGLLATTTVTTFSGLAFGCYNLAAPHKRQCVFFKNIITFSPIYRSEATLVLNPCHFMTGEFFAKSTLSAFAHFLSFETQIYSLQQHKTATRRKTYRMSSIAK